VRNVFDQYDQPENRLTHALACCLAEDPTLLASFLCWLGVAPPQGERLQIVEQRLPGEAEERCEGSEQIERRLPDAWIYTDSGWALLIESKIASPIDAAQLRGHLTIAERRRFSSVQLLVLSPLPSSRALPDRCLHRRWSDLYQWASTEPGSAWARHLTAYFPIAEQRMVDDGYLLEGTLTTFTGIPFDADYPYDYFEAKRLLRLLMLELRADARLDAVGVHRAWERRAIKDRAHGVWDALPLDAETAGSELSHPHFSLVLQRARAIAHLTWPNGMAGNARRRVRQAGFSAFESAIEAFVEGIGPLIAEDAGCVPFISVLQRHSRLRGTEPVRDAVLEFDPRTSVGHGGIKRLSVWLRTAFDAYITPGDANVQLEIGLAFTYGASVAARAPTFADALVRTFLATRPLLALTDSSAAASDDSSASAA